MRGDLVSIVIPTYHREQVLLDTISNLLRLERGAAEILVIDQTLCHNPDVEQQLCHWQESGEISLIRLDKPSITRAMNVGLRLARHNIVLFLDDDIVPMPDLVTEHFRGHVSGDGIWAVMGQVIQPWQQSCNCLPPRKLSALEKDYDFPFNSTIEAEVENVIACNLSVHRELVLSIGGFDERFVGSAYRFETDFARRVINAGGRIRFFGRAGVNHLRVNSGGTRAQGSHLTSCSPSHGFGDYYYAFRHGRGVEAWGYSLKRMFREIRTRFHLTHPWWIPVKLMGEIRAFFMGKKQARKGPKLLSSGEQS